MIPVAKTLSTVPFGLEERKAAKCNFCSKAMCIKVAVCTIFTALTYKYDHDMLSEIANTNFFGYNTTASPSKCPFCCRSSVIFWPV